MQKPTIPYTYLIKHIASGNLYHGSRTKRECNPDEFWKEEGYKTSSRIIKEIIDKEGLESFEIISIEIFSDVNEAILAEETYHKEYDVKGNVCYFNQHNAGEKFNTTGMESKMKGIPRSEETKNKLRIANQGKTLSEETKIKISKATKGENNPRFGVIISEETRDKISRSNKGKTSHMKGKNHSEESKMKMRESSKGKIVSKETKEKISKSKKGIPFSKLTCSHCNKVGGKGAMKRWHFDNCKHKVKDAI